MRSGLLLMSPILCVMAGTSVLGAADFSTYRGLKFGATLAVVAKKAGTTSTQAKLVYQRPAVIQELAWDPGSAARADHATVDPIKEGLLCFFNGELFKIVVTYDRYKIEGMTADDVIEAISATYGPATRPVAEITYHSNYAEVASVLARWEDSDYAYNLVRTGDRSSFALILYSKRTDAMAEAAIAEASRLDALEAPQRELDKESKREADAQLVLEKARAVNKPNFRP